MSWDEGFGLIDVAGLELEALYGGFAGEPFTEDSREYVFVTRAPVGLGLPDHVMEGINRHG